MSQACEAGEPVPEELIGELASLLKAHPRLGGTVVDAVRQGKDRMGALRPALIAAVLRTKDEKLRGALAEAFRATAPPTAAPVTNGEAHDLIARAASPDPALRRDALSRLGSMDGPAATALLTRAALTETDPAARTAAVRSLKGREGPEVSATFLRVLDDPLADAASRRFAATGLATCAGPQVTQTLARHAREAPDEGLRRNAINALARRNDDPLAVATLRAIFDDPATTVGLRRIVQAALVRAGDPAARAAMSVER
jgi:hypothetical protein